MFSGTGVLEFGESEMLIVVTEVSERVRGGFMPRGDGWGGLERLARLLCIQVSHTNETNKTVDTHFDVLFLDERRGSLLIGFSLGLRGAGDFACDCFILLASSLNSLVRPASIRCLLRIFISRERS